MHLAGITVPSAMQVALRAGAVRSVHRRVPDDDDPGRRRPVQGLLHVRDEEVVLRRARAEGRVVGQDHRVNQPMVEGATQEPQAMSGASGVVLASNGRI